VLSTGKIPIFASRFRIAWVVTGLRVERVILVLLWGMRAGRVEMELLGTRAG
jgi:hypothetical protein